MRCLVRLAIAAIVCGTAMAQDTTEPANADTPIDESTLTEAQRVDVEVIRNLSTNIRAEKYEEAAAAFGGANSGQVSPEFLKASAEEMTRLCGAWKSDILVGVREKSGMNVCDLVSVHENDRVRFSFALDKEHKINLIAYFLKPPAELAALATDWLELVQKYEYEEAVRMFDEVMRGLISAETLKTSIESSEKLYGPLKEFSDMRYLVLPGVRPLFVTVKYEKLTMTLQLVFNDKKQIAGMAVIPVSSVEARQVVEQILSQQEAAAASKVP